MILRSSSSFVAHKLKNITKFKLTLRPSQIGNCSVYRPARTHSRPAFSSSGPQYSTKSPYYSFGCWGSPPSSSLQIPHWHGYAIGRGSDGYCWNCYRHGDYYDVLLRWTRMATNANDASYCAHFYDHFRHPRGEAPRPIPR